MNSLDPSSKCCVQLLRQCLHSLYVLIRYVLIKYPKTVTIVHKIVHKRCTIVLFMV